MRPGGFPLSVHLFAGNKAETKALIPVLKQFQDADGVKSLVVQAFLQSGRVIEL